MKKTIGYDLEASGVGFPIGGLAVENRNYNK